MGSDRFEDGSRCSLLCAGIGLFLNLLPGIRYSTSRAVAVNVAPAADWPEPPPLDGSYSASSPALATIKHQVDKARSQDFTTATYELEMSRRRKAS
jgi:hypothetical protein